MEIQVKPLAADPALAAEDAAVLAPKLDATLDPANWDAFAALAHRAVDDMVAFLAGGRGRSAWRPLPSDVRDAFHETLPMGGTSPELVYADFARLILPYTLGNTHPRFWGWVTGSGAPMGVLADMLAAAMNINAAGWDQAAVSVEEQVLQWWVELLGLPPEAGGVLVSSGSQASLVALAVARTDRAGYDIRAAGVRGARLKFYCSTETHSSIQKAVEVLGHGSDSVCFVPVDREFRIDIRSLTQMVLADRARGYMPICVIANAGTVNTGAIDDLAGIADICRREEMWMHVDGAIGAAVAFSSRLRPLLAGIERADSVTCDMHKWLYLPYDVACTLVRDPSKHRAAFSILPSYLAPTGRGTAPTPLKFAQLGIDLSRSFRALKVWMAMKTYGVEGYSRMIEQNVDQAAYLQARIRHEPLLELLAATPLNVVCFRYRQPSLDEKSLDDLNQEILTRMQEQGIAVPSATRVRGRFAIRVAIVNHRSRGEDFDQFLEAVIRLGAQICQENRAE
ncbi:MAG: pyridoxal-dependent decarboxylase [Gemmatimonadota bacterium]|nr:pyridoxal-dependent decarboxylase [Gemmatimonadota bacterium]